jgi:hypothetical protein
MFKVQAHTVDFSSSHDSMDMQAVQQHRCRVTSNTKSTQGRVPHVKHSASMTQQQHRGLATMHLPAGAAQR